MTTMTKAGTTTTYLTRTITDRILTARVALTTTATRLTNGWTTKVMFGNTMKHMAMPMVIGVIVMAITINQT